VAAPDEAGAVADLLAAFRDWWGSSNPDDASMRSTVERLLSDPATDYLLGAAQSDGVPVGVAQVRYRLSVWTGVEDAWIEDLYVRDTARGSGLGRALTELAFERARERGCQRIQLDVNIANEPARSLYPALGFSSFSVVLGADTLLMTRTLQDVRPGTHP
jgi:ribosomal protein S18 acetylase RimI-like enzyme